MASALPDCTLAVTLAWSASTSTLISGLPASVHAFWRGGEVLVGLHGALLDADGLAAGVVGVDALGVALLGDPLGAGLEVADHRRLLHALGVDGEAGDADVVLAALDAEDDRVERGGDPLGLDAELGHDGVEQLDVHADDGLAVGVEVLVGLVGGVGADDDGAGVLDLGRQLRRRGPRRRWARSPTSWRRGLVPPSDSESEPQAVRARAVVATAATTSARVRIMKVLSQGRGR